MRTAVAVVTQSETMLTRTKRFYVQHRVNEILQNQQRKVVLAPTRYLGAIILFNTPGMHLPAEVSVALCRSLYQRRRVCWFFFFRVLTAAVNERTSSILCKYQTSCRAIHQSKFSKKKTHTAFSLRLLYLFEREEGVVHPLQSFCRSFHKTKTFSSSLSHERTKICIPLQRQGRGMSRSSSPCAKTSSRPPSSTSRSTARTPSARLPANRIPSIPSRTTLRQGTNEKIANVDGKNKRKH